MKVRGDRRCKDCGRRWSYYETGSVTCPDCGSLRSVGVGDRALHTDSPADLDLADVRSRVDDEPLDRVAERAAERAGAFVRQSGFVTGGTLRPLSDTYLAAAELRTVGTTLSRELRPDDEAELYFLELLRVTDTGERPAPPEVPESFRAERGLAVASAVADYRSDLRAYLDERDGEREPVAPVLSRLDSHRKRIDALDGAVDPTTTERLVLAAREIYEFLVEDDETALASAGERLSE